MMGQPIDFKKLGLDWSYFVVRLWYFKSEDEPEEDFLKRAGISQTDKSKWAKPGNRKPNRTTEKLERIFERLQVPEWQRYWLAFGDGPPPPAPAETKEVRAEGRAGARRKKAASDSE